MRITYGTAELASDDLALGRVGPVGFSLNGTQINEEVEFFRALHTEFLDRDGRSEAVSFTVERFFGTEAACVRFLATHRNDLPGKATLLMTLDGETISLSGAVLDSVQRGEWRGLSCRVTYGLRGPAFATDLTPLPEPDPTMTRSGLADVADGAETVAVVFSSPLPGVPQLVPGAVLQMPTAGGDVIFAAPIADTITASGLTFALSGPPAGSGYKLPYQAFYTA